MCMGHDHTADRRELIVEVIGLGQRLWCVKVTVVKDGNAIGLTAILDRGQFVF